MVRRELQVQAGKSDQEKDRRALLLRNLYRSFVDNTFEIIFRSTINDTVEFSNKLFIESFGFKDYQSAKGFPVTGLFEGKDDYVLLKNELLSDHKIRKREVRLKSLSGKIIVALINVQIQLNEKGESVFLWAALDISERQQFERNLDQKTQQLTKINNQMEKFLYSTSHDLRAPLTTIMGLVNLIRMDTNDSNVLEYVGKIEGSTMRLDKIIRDIISFSKTTYKHVHSEKVDFESMIWKIIELNRNEEHFDKIRKEVKIIGKDAFYSDLDRMEIILSNLIGNAIRFLDINKVFSFIRIEVVISPDRAVIDVHDNGIGIARTYFEQIFGMFFKASLQSKGAGLGLYITKESTEQLDGSISIQSEVGFGSLFKVIIPNGVKGKLINRKYDLKKRESLTNLTQA